MDAAGLRRAFTGFFADRDHTVVPSAGLIPHHPSAPMFTNSGMMPFVPYFLGEEAVPWSPARAASVQKCVRAGGKHNDLDAIGRSLRHLSFFEMLGNFSFGDYFKADAIPLGLGVRHRGARARRRPAVGHRATSSDDEAEQIWADEVGFPARAHPAPRQGQLLGDGRDRARAARARRSSSTTAPSSGPTAAPPTPLAEDRYVEIWNLVFQQYFRHADGSLDRPAEPQHRHRRRARAHPGRPGGQPGAATPPTPWRCWSTRRSRSPAASSGSTRPPTWRCACWPTTPAP